MIKVKQFVFSPFGVNTYLVMDEDTHLAAVIDPAMSNAEERAQFDDFVKASGAKITQIINTHLHLDHCFGENYVKDRYGVPVKAHAGDAELGRAMADQYRRFGMNGEGQVVEIDALLSDGDRIEIGNSTLEVIHVPGHSPGGIALYDRQTQLLFSGDSLFCGGIGRTDLPGGDYAQLVGAIRSRLLSLPPETTVLPGHSDPTTIDAERRYNPYV